MAFKILEWIGAILLLAVTCTLHAQMAVLSDDDLAGVSGQALIFTDVTQGSGISSGLTFYTMGLDAQMALNANIRKLQLGCGGINGANGCDIDIDNFSLSGQPGVGGCPSSGGTVTCDMVFTRPAFTFAISGDGTPDRQVVGFQLGAQKASGLMTAGFNDGTANGINNLSGFFQTEATTGTTQTAADPISAAPPLPPSGSEMTGKANFTGCVAGCPASLHTTGGTVTVPAVTGVIFDVPSFNYYGYRTGGVSSNTTAIISGITSTLGVQLTDAGPISANIPGCVVAIILPVCNVTINSIGLTAQITNLKANITLTEPLGYLHSIPVNNPFSMSFERQSVVWPGMSASHPATTGWFMSVADPVNLGSLATPVGYSADISSANPNISTEFSSYLNANPLSLSFSQVLFGLIGAHITVNAGTLDFSSYPAVSIPLANLPLGGGQTPPGNCYGTAKFC